MRTLVLALAATLAASAVSAQAPAPGPNAPTTPQSGPPGSGVAPQPRYKDAVHPYELRPGDRIRVWDRAGTLRREDGTVVGADQGGIAATLDGVVRHLRYDEIDKLETRRGRGRPKLGAVLGFALGSLLYAALDDSSDNPSGDYLFVAGTFTAFGAAAGNYALAPSWKPVETRAEPSGPQSPELHRESRGPEGGLRVTLRF